MGDKRERMGRMKRYTRILGPAGGLFAVAALMALAPTAGAVIIHKATLLTPAFKGASKSIYNSVSVYGCGIGKNAKPITWSSITGMGGFAGSAKTCKVNGPGGNGGSVYW